MPRTDARRRGAAARAVWTLVLVGLLACVGLGSAGERPYGDRSRAADAAVDRAAPTARTHAGARTRVADRAAAVDAPVTASPGDGRTPGCRDDSGSDGGLAPAAPPRGLSSGELLPLPHDARGAAAGAGWGAWEPPATGPGRAPPALAPPSPMDLSILRV